MPSSLLPAFNAAIPYQALFLGARIAFHLFSNPNPIRVSTSEFLPTKTDYVHVDPTHTVLPSPVPWFYTALAVGLCFIAAVVGGWLCVHRTTSQTKRPWSSVRAIAAASVLLQAFRTILVDVGLVDTATVFVLALGFALKDQLPSWHHSLNALLPVLAPHVLPALAVGLCIVVAVAGGWLCIRARLNWRAGNQKQPRWCLWTIPATLAVLKAFPVGVDTTDVATILCDFEANTHAWLKSLVVDFVAYISDQGPRFIQSTILISTTHIGLIAASLFLRRAWVHLPQIPPIVLELADVAFIAEAVPFWILMVNPIFRQVVWIYCRYAVADDKLEQLSAKVGLWFARSREMLLALDGFQKLCALAGILHGVFTTFQTLHLVPLLVRYARWTAKWHVDLGPMFAIRVCVLGFCIWIVSMVVITSLLVTSQPTAKLFLLDESLGWRYCLEEVWAMCTAEASRFRNKQYADLSALIDHVLHLILETCSAWFALSISDQFIIACPVIAFYLYWDIIPFYRRARITYRIVRRKLRRRWRI
ncbi:hypothetical protein HMN09_00314600 [Mycena chlorophos]|uniref:Uncharacterized protein n=1 Tax=Mycena chlorophos TaxID=658473 RepID=A0A8H6THZ8_MYCCL|nr:hypothetical protein HMN09_00314600 [Mycena chlorophos]